MFIWQDKTVEKIKVWEQTTKLRLSPNGFVANITHGQSCGSKVFQEKGVRGQVKIASVGLSSPANGQYRLDDDEAQD
jgi:hypothetical protein